MTDQEMEIWMLVRESNRAWVGGALGELGNFFAPDAVVVAPRLQARVAGREAIVKSFQDFLHHARTHFFEEQEHFIDVFGETAVVTYRFAIRYTLASEDQEREEGGQEILVLRRSAGSWQAVWRTQIPDEE